MKKDKIKNIKAYVWGVNGISLTILIMLLLISSVSAQINNFQRVTSQPIQYGKTIWKIQLKTDFENPYWSSEIALDMKISTPSGKKISLPCFYVEGGSGEISKWEARFTPREPGAYKAQFELSKNGQLSKSGKSFEFSVKSSDGRGFLSMNDNWTFKFDNGELFRGIGENICWEARSNDDSKYFKTLHEKPKYNFDYMLGQLAKNGGNYFRVWMCSWNLPLEFKKVSNNTNRYSNTDKYFNPGAIKRMDELVDLCDSIGIHMMLCIDQSGNYRGGMEWSNYHINHGGSATNKYEFLTLPEAREQYKNRLRYLIARWGYSSSIGAWEFFNEIDYLGYGEGDSVLTEMHRAIVDWHDDMSTFMKENDPYKHPITTSVSHRDVVGLNEVKNIDFNQKHIYKNTGSIPSVIVSYTEKYGKPYVIGEFGYEWDWHKNFNNFAKEMNSDYKRGLWLGLFNPTPILPLSWWWEFFEDRGLFPYFKNVREMYNNMMNTGEGQFSKIEVKPGNESLETCAVRCGNKVYAYIFNKGEQSMKVELKFEGVQLDNNNPQLFNCETGKYALLKEFRISKGCNVKTNKVLKNIEDVILIFNVQ